MRKGCRSAAGCARAAAHPDLRKRPPHRPPLHRLQTHTLVQVPCSYFLSYFW